MIFLRLSEQIEKFGRTTAMGCLLNVFRFVMSRTINFKNLQKERNKQEKMCVKKKTGNKLTAVYARKDREKERKKQQENSHRWVPIDFLTPV